MLESNMTESKIISLLDPNESNHKCYCGTILPLSIKVCDLDECLRMIQQFGNASTWIQSNQFNQRKGIREDVQDKILWILQKNMLGLSQKSLAKITGIHISTISKGLKTLKKNNFIDFTKWRNEDGTRIKRGKQHRQPVKIWYVV